MTLVATIFMPPYVMHVSDRMVSQEILHKRSGAPTGRFRKFDGVTNKCILYEARDGVAVIGCSGLAYIGQKPIDQWMAELLWGEEISGDEPGRPPMVVGRAPQWLDVGQVTALLRNALESAYPRDPASRGSHEVIVAGWQWNKRRRARPFGCIVRNGVGGDSTRFEVFRLARRWHEARQPDADWRPATLLLAGWRAFQQDDLAQLHRSIGSAPSSDEVLSALVSAIRAVSEHAPENVVGRDCLAVIIPKPEMRQIDVVFESESPTLAGVWDGPQLLEVVPASFSPWIIGPSRAIPPCIFVGTRTESLPSYDVVLHAPPVPREASTRIAWSPQERPNQRGIRHSDSDPPGAWRPEVPRPADE